MPTRDIHQGPLTTRPRVLLVEDDPTQRDMYATYLLAKGLRVITAVDGSAAISLAFEFLPDIIVMDLALPHVDGWQATRRLKQDACTAGIPIVACTAHILRGSVEKAIDAGCDAYITKPCLPNDLLVEIRRMLAQHQKPKIPGSARLNTRRAPAAYGA
jgi:two-component system, cell cycle response regulator DivK